jgi:hypothetical protein
VAFGGNGIIRGETTLHEFHCLQTNKY